MQDRRGYIPLYRKFFDHYLWTEDREFSKAEAWLDCIHMARYKHSKTKKLISGKLIEWGYGQFPASVRFLRDRWGWRSNTKVENFLSLLESDGMVKTAKGQGQTVITLCNFATYDPNNINKNPKKEQTEDTDRTPEGQGEDTGRTEGGQAEDGERTEGGRNSKKGNKGKKEKKGKKGEREKNKSSPAPPGKRELPGFEDYRDQPLEISDVQGWMEKNEIDISTEEFEYELSRFRDSFSGKRYKDWVATLRNYLRHRYLETEHWDYKRNGNGTTNTTNRNDSGGIGPPGTIYEDDILSR